MTASYIPTVVSLRFRIGDLVIHAVVLHGACGQREETIADSRSRSPPRRPVRIRTIRSWAIRLLHHRARAEPTGSTGTRRGASYRPGRGGAEGSFSRSAHRGRRWRVLLQYRSRWRSWVRSFLLGPGESVVAFSACYVSFSELGVAFAAYTVSFSEFIVAFAAYRVSFSESRIYCISS